MSALFATLLVGVFAATLIGGAFASNHYYGQSLRERQLFEQQLAAERSLDVTAVRRGETVYQTACAV